MNRENYLTLVELSDYDIPMSSTVSMLRILCNLNKYNAPILTKIIKQDYRNNSTTTTYEAIRPFDTDFIDYLTNVIERYDSKNGCSLQCNTDTKEYCYRIEGQDVAHTIYFKQITW